MIQYDLPMTVDLGDGFRTIRGLLPNVLALPGNKNAHTWIFRIIRNGDPENLEGASIMGKFENANGITIPILGTISGNTASVTMAQSCYAVSGKLRCVFTLTTPTVGPVPLADIVISVSQPVGPDVSDPLEIIPDMAELLAMIETVNDATEVADAAAAAAIAAAEAARNAQFTVLGMYATLAELQVAHPVGEAGYAYAVGTSAANVIYVWDINALAWANLGNLQGIPGNQGIQGIPGIPGVKGDQGIQGPAGPATIAIGTTSVGAAAVNNSGTSSNVVLNFTLPAASGVGVSLADAGGFFPTKTAEAALQHIGSLNATNLITNGNFANTTGWTGRSGTIAAAGNVLTHTASAVVASARIDRGSITNVAGRKYYCAFDINPYRTHQPRFRFGGATGTCDQTAPAGQFTRVSGVITADATSNEFWIYTNGAATTEMDVGDTAQFRNALLVDLTAIFGAGSEPTAAQMDAYLARWENGWFDGTVNIARSDKMFKWITDLKGAVDALIAAPAFSNSGLLMYDFESLTGWNTTGTVAADTAHKTAGAQGIKLTTPAGGTATVYRSNILPGLKLSGKNFGVWAYFDEDPNLTCNAIKMEFSSDNFASKSLVGNTQIFRRGWNCLCLAPSQFTVSGGESFVNALNFMRIRVEAKAGQVCNVTLDDWRHGVAGKPRIIITFDDCDETAYTEGLAYMYRKGMRGVMYVAHNLVGQAGYVTQAQILDAHNKGWDIANHSDTHSNFGEVTDVTEIGNNFRACATWLESLGLSRASKHIAYPGGGYNDHVLQAMANIGAMTGRTVKSGGKEIFHGEETLALPVGYVLNDTPVSTVKSWIDRAPYQQGALILVFHKLMSTNAVPYDYLISDFREIIDYIYDTGIPVTTMSEWYSQSNAAK